MKKIIAQALNNTDFCLFFARTGGGFHPVDNHPLLSRNELICRYCMSETEWFNFEHRYWPNDKQVGAVMSADDVQSQFKVREIQKSKIWRFYVAYLNDLSPMSPSVDRLLLNEYKVPWVLAD